ncbi:MAG: hypothetical protein JW951_05275 [Lentisphaerae bacterium]|nr:hypothetical protein [Lentisphaerota bacterium]
MISRVKRAALLGAAACLTLEPMMAEDAIPLRTTPQIESSIFGTCTHFPNRRGWVHEDLLPIIEETGFKWIRDYASWAEVEKEKGVLRIPDEHWAWINDAHARGLNICMPLVFFNWKHSMKDWPAYCEAYARYCTFVVGELKDKVQIWELWNEPAVFFRTRAPFGGEWNAREGPDTPWLKHFMEFMITAARAIRAEHPEVILVAGDVVLPVNCHMLDMLKEQDAVDLLDGIVLHPYCHRVTPETLPWGGPKNNERDGVVTADDDHSYASAVRRTREKMRAVGMKTTDIYVTESGFSTQPHSREHADAQDMGLNLETQAKYLARMFLLHKALGVKVAIQYDFQDDTVKYEPIHPQGKFGLILDKERGYVKKPAWFAMRRICSLFADPVQVWQPDWSVDVEPPGYINNSKWPYTPGVTTWTDQEVKALDRVMTYVYRNEETGEVLLAAWNAIEPGPRSHLITTITLGTDQLAVGDGVDLMTGEAFGVNAEAADGKTVLTEVIVPDYPIVIRMKPAGSAKDT